MTKNLAAGVNTKQHVRNMEGDNMSMEKLIEEVKECVEREYGRAGAKFGPTNHSDHESYAVILEEIQEAEQEILQFKESLGHFWYFVKNDYDPSDKLSACKEMQRRALLGACELIQVSAMAKKAVVTICDRESAKGAEGDSE